MCFASIPDFSDSAYWMYRHLMASRAGLHFTWLVHDETHADQVSEDFRSSPHANNHRLEVLPWHSVAAYRAYLRSSVVFHTHGVFNFVASRPDRTVVSLWHGMPMKVICAFEDSGRFANDVGGDIHVASSRLYRSVIAAAFLADPKSVLVSGLPRADVLKGHLPPVLDRTTIAETVGLDPDRPIVVWLPTHRDDSADGRVHSFLDQIDDDVLHALVQTCERAGVQVVVKLHPLDGLNDGYDGPLASNAAVHFLTSEAWTRSGAQLYDLLAAADGMITDLSSAAIDFLHTRRPIGIVGYDESTYERDMIVPMGPLTASEAIFHLRDAETIAQFVGSLETCTPIELPDNDVAHWVIEDGDICSSETIAAAVGL